MRADGGGETLPEALERNRVEHPSKPFIVSHESVLTYGEMARLAAGFAGFLRSSGVGPGDRVCLMLPRVPELIISLLGAMRVGALPVPVNYTVSTEEVRRFVAANSPAVLVVDEKIPAAAPAGPARAPGATVVVVGREIGGAHPGGRPASPRMKACPQRRGSARRRTSITRRGRPGRREARSPRTRTSTGTQDRPWRPSASRATTSTCACSPRSPTPTNCSPGRSPWAAPSCCSRRSTRRRWRGPSASGG